MAILHSWLSNFVSEEVKFSFSSKMSVSGYSHLTADNQVHKFLLFSGKFLPVCITTTLKDNPFSFDITSTLLYIFYLFLTSLHFQNNLQNMHLKSRNVSVVVLDTFYPSRS